MPDLGALRHAIERIHIINTNDEREQLLETLLHPASPKPLTLDFLNQHAGNLLVGNDEFRSAFLDTDIILRDGIGLKLAMSILGKVAGLNMNGTDFIPALVQVYLQQHPTKPLLIFGTAEPWLSRGAAALAGDHKGGVALVDGFQQANVYCDAAAEHAQSFKLILLAMGMPKQEQVARALKNAAIGPALIVCGGAIVDFAAQRFARAPAWIRDLGLEWLYRLANEPRRLFARYVIGIPLFLARVALSRIHARASYGDS
ncbi:MAG: b-glycosyltransferase, Glycosyltransferase Family 26-like protein [Verrucomicrobiaceae bacterium]|nr:b-glycosyltransferase, Glycosyltransferase Family 26-like protein [Verrucomicrobiaceae bacterium]